MSEICNENLFEADQDYIWSKVESHTSLALIPRSVSWCKLWDKARDHRFQGSRSSQDHMLINYVHYVTLLHLKVYTPAANHIFSHVSCGLEHLLEILSDDDKDSDIFSVGKELKRLYHVYNF